MIFKVSIIALNLIFGPILLYSYWNGIKNGNINGVEFWGGMPQFLRPVSGISMIISAIGYFIFTYYLLFKTNNQTQYLGMFNNTFIIILYALILIPSCFWIGKTIDYMNLEAIKDHAQSWMIICIILYTVGIASFLLCLSIFSISPDVENYMLFNLSKIGIVIFTIHTLFFDGLVWTYFFNLK